MNHILDLNGKRYVIRQQQQKIVVFTLPLFNQIYKYYAYSTSSFLNHDTKQLLIIHKNQLTIFKPAILPLQLVVTQKSFIQWQPRGGILLKNKIIFFGDHSIGFYERNNLLQKSWQIQIVQQIQEIKNSRGDNYIAMKVSHPNNTLFVWNINNLTMKPSQQVILTQSILQWQFINNHVLAILTLSGFRVYLQDTNSNQFNLYHFYEVKYNSFCWIGSNSQFIQNKQSLNTVIFMQAKGCATLVELYDIEKRTNYSKLRQLGNIKLSYKNANMRKVKFIWGQNDKLVAICQTKNKHIFSFSISQQLEINNMFSQQEILGCSVSEVYGRGNLIITKDKDKWKYFQYLDEDDFDFLDEVICEKAFIGTNKNELICFDKQSIIIRRNKLTIGEPIAFKYSDTSKIHLLGIQNKEYYFVIGIRFYKLNQNSISSIGFSIRNEKAILYEVNPFFQTIEYKIGDQYMLMKYKINNSKVTVSSIKSSIFPCHCLKNGNWVQEISDEIRVGVGEKILTSFPIAKLLKLLDSDDKTYKYSIYCISGNGIALVIKNYVFFLQFIDDQKGCQLIILKRFNNVLYKRFSHFTNQIKLIQADSMIFWVGNTLKSINLTINRGNITDPYGLPETLLSKQFEMQKVYPPHHPKLLVCLIQNNRIQVLLQVLHQIYDWFCSNFPISVIFNTLGIQFFKKCLTTQNIENNVSRFSEKKIQDEIQFLNNFSNVLLQKLQMIQLKQNNSLYFETIVSSLSYALQNAKNMDEFSQILIILSKTPFKPKKYNSMHICLLSHSLNKEQALLELRKDIKIQWDFMKQYSIPLWYDNREQIRQLIQEMAGNQYRSKKDPFDCLFWYIFIGKKVLIGNLFKNHKMDSKQHDAITNFLLRDFNQAKDRAAAVKNAYVLFDKKRYFHAMAFFILGNSIDDCIRICLDRLKDINLAYLFILFFKEAKTDYFQSEIKKGDVWMNHFSYKLQGKHILAYNALFGHYQNQTWTYEPQICGFHPYLYEFALKIKNSIGVKRQLQAQNNAKNNASQDIFADFYEQQTKVQVIEKCENLTLADDYQTLRQQSILYYLKQGLPILGLLQNSEHTLCMQSYNFHKYKINGQIDNSMQNIVVGLNDKLNIIKCYLSKSKIQQVLHFIKHLCLSFRKLFKSIHLNLIIQTQKYIIGQLLHLGFYLEQIKLYLMDKNQLFIQYSSQFQTINKTLKQYVNISKIIASLMLNKYEYIYDLLLHLKGHFSESQQTQKIWPKLKSKYDNIHQTKYQKHIKQMDNFEHAFIKAKRKNDETDHRMYLQLSREEGSILYFRLLICNYLIDQCNISLKQQIVSIRNDIDNCIKNWITSNSKKDIFFQYDVLIKQGTQYKMKLNFLKDVFEEEFVACYDVLALVHHEYFQQTIGIMSRQDQNTQLQGIEIFRNRQDSMKSFIINKHDSKGLQCIVMFKRGLKKFQVCENIIKRERSKDNYSLILEDGFNTNLAYPDPESYRKFKNAAILQQSLTHILDIKNIYNGNAFPRSFTSYNEKDYIRQTDHSYLDYNELNSIQCHPNLPFFLIGGKSYIQLAHLSNLKNFDRIKCPSMSQIIKIHSCSQRIGAIDSIGTFNVYNFDSKYVNNCVYSIKKMNTIDFTFIKPSVLATITNNSVSIYDTLIHPTKQLKFKQPFSKEPISICTINDKKIAVLRKNQLLIYDIRMQKVQNSRQLKGKGRCLIFNDNDAYIGLNDGRVKVFSLLNDKHEATIKLGNYDEKERQRINVDQLNNYGSIIFASTNEGSIFYLPKITF